jgi:hypothetical protein
VAPPHEFPSHLKLEFTATDSRGMSSSEAVEIYPRIVEVGVESDPAGVPLGIEGVVSSEPSSATMIAGGSVTVSAPETASIGGQGYEFSEWSDGGARVHEVTSGEDVDLVAHYVLEQPEEPEEPEPEEPQGPGEGPPPAARPPSLSVAELPPPAMAHLRLASKPPGVPLQVGFVRAVAPFSAELAIGARTSVVAPPKVHRHGQTLRFRRWVKDGRGLGASRRREVAIGGDARYLALYAASGQRPGGAR